MLNQIIELKINKITSQLFPVEVTIFLSH